MFDPVAELLKIKFAGGTSGAPGKSAYEVAVDDGFVGTASAWVASLVGPPGADSTVPGPASTVPGPNQVTTATASNITGLLKGTGSAVAQASAPSDYVATGDSRLTDARTPTTHSHAEADVTSLTTDLAAKAATSHTHAESAVTNLTTDLAGKAAASHSHAPGDVTGTAVVTADSRLSDARTPLTHSHAESDTTGLVTDLSGKAATSHTHSEANVTNLTTDLAGKAASTHSHAESDITNLTTDLAAKVTANAGISAGTATKITYDAKGLVTAGTAATTADIADSADKRYCTDAQKTIIGNTSGTNSGDGAANSSSTYIGTTQVALNRTSGALTLAGITLTTPNIGAATGTSAALTGAITSSGGGIGYAAGAGGTVTQGTSKSTAVTLSKLCGTITMNSAALANATTVAFTLTNTLIAANDFVDVQHASAGTIGAYTFGVAPAAGSAVISVRNVHTASLSEAIVLRFVVIKAVVA
jgi:hypothetical protein